MNQRQLAASSPRVEALPPPRLFRSFWLAGFEAACHINGGGLRLDMAALTQHDTHVDLDYALLRGQGIRMVRESMRWHLIERGGRFDFSSLVPYLEAARRHGIGIIWSLCHYGWPDDVHLFSPRFIDRFARYAAAVARFIAEHDDAVPFYNPINEISFFSWAAAQVAYIYPFKRDQGGTLKRQLIRATVAGCEALWSVDPRARIVHVDPLIHVVTPRGRPDLAAAAAAQRASQFEAWDMLAGRVEPELGGSVRLLDIMGLNYYHANQWEHPDVRLRWEDTPRDERWVPLHRLLGEVYQRYERPLFIAETSHFGVGRGPWLREIAAEVALARRQGTPIEGICLYPIIDRPDWDDLEHWHNSGLWDLARNETGELKRVLVEDYAVELRNSQRMLARQGCV